MSQEIIKNSADGATLFAISTGAGNYLGWFDFINQNAGGVGVIISFLSFVVGAAFYILTYNKPDKSRDNSNKIMELEAELFDTKKQIQAISDRKINTYK